jgi:hypothetical protein
MNYSRCKSIVLNNSANPRIYRTFQDWQAEQLLDVRTPEQRGISVGSPVMWRYMHNRVIVTDRATVVAIAGDTLTLLVKDVRDRTCNAHIREIVNSKDDRPSLSRYEMNRQSYLSHQSDAENPTHPLPGSSSTPHP